MVAEILAYIKLSLGNTVEREEKQIQKPDKTPIFKRHPKQGRKDKKRNENNEGLLTDTNGRKHG
jgi:hypothetical protein